MTHGSIFHRFGFTNLLAALIACLSLCSAEAATRRVPADYPTIQAGIDAAVDGDVVLVSSGVYAGTGNRDIRLHGKAITVRSEEGPSVTIIDPQGAWFFMHIAFFLDEGEGPGTVIEGFTIQHGLTTHGGGIYCDGSSPLIRNCTFYRNIATEGDVPGFGAGLFCWDGSPQVEDCAFIENYDALGAVYVGGAGSSLTLVRCVFDGNEYLAGTVVADAGANIYLEHCTLVANDYGPVLLSWGSASIVASRSLVGFNSGPAADCEATGSSIELSCCDVFGNSGGDWVDCIAGQAGVVGNFSADPRLCGLPLHDVGLEPDSPCLPGHHPRGDDCELIGAMPLGCGSSATTPATWGTVKARFDQPRAR